MPSRREALVTALKAEFGGDVSFSAAPPSTFTAPSIVVTPADPFLTPDTHGQVRETWDILAVVSMKLAASGIDQMRTLSLRIMRAVHPQGAVWRSASAPYLVATDENKGLVAAKNRVDFKFTPDEELSDDNNSSGSDSSGSE